MRENLAKEFKITLPTLNWSYLWMPFGEPEQEAKVTEWPLPDVIHLLFLSELDEGDSISCELNLDKIVHNYLFLNFKEICIQPLQFTSYFC